VDRYVQPSYTVVQRYVSYNFYWSRQDFWENISDVCKPAVGDINLTFFLNLVLSYNRLLNNRPLGLNIHIDREFFPSMPNIGGGHCREILGMGANLGCQHYYVDSLHATKML
jgi:hypothetical protein